METPAPTAAITAPPPPASRTEKRQLAIALVRDLRLSRAAVCRLVEEPKAWLGAGGLEAAALRVGVPAAQVSLARELAQNATREARREEEEAARRGLTILVRGADEDYPDALEDLALPPPVLYLSGRAEALVHRRAVAIVGARKMDAYGRDVARSFARELAKAGATIVSGFAIGVDSEAHDATLEAGGRTVAVLGCGLDIDYPRGSRARAAAIAQEGALITEFPLGCLPKPFNFPVRNRLIAALAQITLVIQARLRSGSLITANHALDLGRDVFAVPGRITDELALGVNNLIAEGAYLALCARDLIEKLGLAAPVPRQMKLDLPAEPAQPGEPGKKGKKTLLGCLAYAGEGKLAEELAEELGQTLDQVLGDLLELELEGRAERHPGPVYTLRR